MGPHLTSIIGAAVKTEHVLKYYQNSYEIPDPDIRGELLPSCYMIIAGKSKVIDKLGFVRQIHDKHFKMLDIFDWITSDKWYPSYLLFRDKAVKALVDKDNISHEKAERVF